MGHFVSSFGFLEFRRDYYYLRLGLCVKIGGQSGSLYS